MTVPAGRSWFLALLRGLGRKCPRCGTGFLFTRYVAVVSNCGSCGLDLRGQRADDAPPYFAIFVAGHVVVPLLLLTEKLWAPPLWLHFLVWLPATLFLVVWLLPRVKGGVIGLQWAFGMHGFEGDREQAQNDRET